jgi:hypothetical protein
MAGQECLICKSYFYPTFPPKADQPLAEVEGVEELQLLRITATEVAQTVG